MYTNYGMHTQLASNPGFCVLFVIVLSCYQTILVLQCKKFHWYGALSCSYYKYAITLDVLTSIKTVLLLKALIDQASTKLMRSLVNSGNDESKTHTLHRVSKQAWLSENESQAALSLTQRIQNFLDLLAFSFKDAEEYQIANYGFAGQYDVHYDQIMMDPNAPVKRDYYNTYLGDRLTTVSKDILSNPYF